MFRMLFERSADAILLLDPQREVYVDCNQAAVDLMRATTKEQLLLARPADLSPDCQPDGRNSLEKTHEITARTLASGSHRFEWLCRRLDGTEFHVEVLGTTVQTGDHPLVAVVCRDITDRKAAEAALRENEARFRLLLAQRTSELVQANEHLRQSEQALRQRGTLMQKHRDVLLALARAPKSDLNRALAEICARAAATLEVARVSYWSLREPESAIVCELLHLRDTGQADETFRGAQVRAADCPSYFEALAARRPIVANDVLRHPATCGLADSYLRPLGIASMLDAPVWVRGEVVGVLCHEHTGPARSWSAEEVDFVSALATMVSLALEESQRARSEHRLRESEEKFRALFEASSQGVILHDEEQMLEVNPACLRILGFQSAGELVGKHPADISARIQPGGESADLLARRHIRDCLAQGSARFEWLACNSRGGETPIEVILTRIRWGGRQILQAVFNDIAARKQAEAELQESAARLRESEARFSTAFHASPVLITISRLSDAAFIEVNEAFIRWIGLSREEICGRDSEALGMWVSREARVQFLSELRRLGSVRNVECQVRSQRGTLHTMLLSADLIDTGRDPHVLVFGLDITERLQAEAEMLRTLAREKELGQLRTSFVSMVSHEFRTPLGIIQSSAEILEDYLDQLQPAERQDHLQSIRKNTRRMAGLMEEVLLIGSLDAGKLEFKPAPLDLRNFARRLVEEVLSATDRRCPIELSLDNLPAAAQADVRLLRHVFTNLLTNAVKYSPAATPVRFHLWSDGAEAVCVVHDRGIGISEADREWLFHPFHRGRNVGDRPGTGLGLVIVKRCLDLHGGYVSVESQLGAGTTMTVKLPLFGPASAGPGSSVNGRP